MACDKQKHAKVLWSWLSS